MTLSEPEMLVPVNDKEMGHEDSAVKLVWVACFSAQ